MCVGFPDSTAQFSMWKTTGKDSPEACAIACQNWAVYSVFSSGMTRHTVKPLSLTESVQRPVVGLIQKTRTVDGAMSSLSNSSPSHPGLWLAGRCHKCHACLLVGEECHTAKSCYTFSWLTVPLIRLYKYWPNLCILNCIRLYNWFLDKANVKLSLL